MSTDLEGRSSDYGLNGEYLDMEEVCVNMELELNGAISFSTTIYYMVERLLSSGEAYSVQDGIFADKYKASDAFRAACLTESGYYRVTLYQQYGDAVRTNDYSKIVLTTKVFNLNIKGKPQEKFLTTNTGMSYYEYATLYLYEAKADGGLKSDPEWTFKMEDGKAEIYFVVRMNSPLRLSSLKAKISSYEPKVSAKTGPTRENIQLYKETSWSIPSKDWNAAQASFTIENKGSYFIELYSQDDQFIETISFKVK